MSATDTETVVVSRGRILEVLAALQGSGDFVLNKQFSREVLSNCIGRLGNELREQLIGPPDEYDPSDPTEIELYALSVEYEARLIDSGMQALVSHVETTAFLEGRSGRSGKLREHANQIREAGTIEVRFPTTSEMSVIVRAQMNAEVAS